MNYQKQIDSYRPIPFYFLTTTASEDYTDEAVFEAMQKMKDNGYGGIVLFNKPPVGFDAEGYLSETWFEITGRFIQACRKLGLELWINDGFNFPPGDAAGRIEAVDPTLKQLRLIPNEDGKLDIVEVAWGFPAFEEEKSSELFIKFVYEEYYKRFAKYFGDGITGFFSDADNRRYNAHVIKDCPERYYPWSKNFPALFKKKFNYAIEEKLKELFNGTDKQIMHDYWQLCGDLYQQWFANNHAWCKSHGVLYTFHTSDSGPMNYEYCKRSSAFTEGDPLTLLANSDAPGTDHEIFVLDSGTHYDKRYYTQKVTFAGDDEFLYHPHRDESLWDVRAKYAQSAAVLNNKKRIMCEMFAATNHHMTFNDLNRIAAWQIIQGINFIVPHAVHHRFCDSIKYFAPPVFNWTTLEEGVREFNDALAFNCMAAAEGEYIAEYAVIDPTPEVWQDISSTPFFHLCDKLNRRADGYIIVPRNYSGPIKNIIDPVKEIPELPAPQVTFSGGDLAYMRRRLNGEEYLIAANVWNPETVSGTLLFNDKSYNVEFNPGEIAVFGGPFENFREPAEYQIQQTFDGEYPVKWEHENLIPFEKEIDFTCINAMTLTLSVPAENTGKVFFNGLELADAADCFIFHDKYRKFTVNAVEGSNRIEFEKPCRFVQCAYLGGEFDVEVETSNDYADVAYTQYLLAMYNPGMKKFTLSPRRTALKLNCGWEKQGHIFYSGSIELNLGSVEINANETLLLPQFKGTAELVIDKKAMKRKSVAPYNFELPNGRHDIILRLWNTMGNQLERFAVPSGITAPVQKIIKK
ncbi:MAG: hypothetical protein IKB71_06405 [Lentisphaeria bacterium]|nr:hypothetical protein [Lentisphaeria bacterium]